MAWQRWRSWRSFRRGFALLIVLLLIVTLSVVVFILMREVVREYSIGANVRDDLSAANLAGLGLTRASTALLLDDKQDYDSLNETWAKPRSWTGETFGREEGGGEEGSTFSEPRMLITDEERKFNLLLLVRGTKEQRDKAVAIFKRLVNICRRDDDRLKAPGALDGVAKVVRRRDDDTANTDTLARNLLRYLEERASEDSDDLEMTAATGEKPDIRGMKKQTPYQMLTLGELLQIEGWTHELLHGGPRVAEGQPGQPGQPGQEEDTRHYQELTQEEQFERTRLQIEELDIRSRDPEPLPLIHYLTLYSSGRININTCSRELLLALDEGLTWDVVDHILIAREQDRRDVLAAEEAGGTLPQSLPDESGQTEDLASFRPQDIASYQAFVARATNDGGTGGTAPTLEGFTQEIYNAIRPLLSVRSTVFRVEATAKVGKITNTIYALYRRTSGQPAANPANPANPTNPASPTTPSPASTGSSATGDLPLPPEPTARLTLLFKDVKQD